MDTVTISTFGPGTLAYADFAFVALIPCKVTAVNGDDVTVTLTATRGAYRKGESLTAKSHAIVPRTSVFTRNGQYRIRNSYRWISA